LTRFSLVTSFESNNSLRLLSSSGGFVFSRKFRNSGKSACSRLDGLRPAAAEVRMTRQACLSVLIRVIRG
jgi:hypothetical protein